MNFEQAVSSSFRELGQEEMKKEQILSFSQNSTSDWFRFKRSPPAPTPDAKAADCGRDCTRAGMITKQKKNVLCFETLKKTSISLFLKRAKYLRQLS